MKLNEYQKLAVAFDLMSREEKMHASSPSYVAKVLGLAGEAGEVAEKYKKIIRDKNGKVSEADAAEIIKELGDVLWYVSAISSYLGADLQTVAETNLAKLGSRKTRGSQRGSGDNR